MISLWVGCYLAHLFGFGMDFKWWSLPFVYTMLIAIALEVYGYSRFFSYRAKQKEAK